MYLITKRDWPVLDGSQHGKTTKLKAGRYEVERVSNPVGPKDSPWLVLKGTLIGAAEKHWRIWCSSARDSRGNLIDWGDLEVTIED